MKTAHACILVVGWFLAASLLGCSKAGEQAAAPPPTPADSRLADGQERAGEDARADADTDASGDAGANAAADGADAAADVADAAADVAPAAAPPAATYDVRPRMMAPDSAVDDAGTAGAFESAAASPSDAEPTADRHRAAGDGSGPFESLPAGASFSADDGYATVQVFYGTDRAAEPLPLSAYQVSGQRTIVWALVVLGLSGFVLAVLSLFRGRSAGGAICGVVAGGCGLLLLWMAGQGTAGVEKSGVSYGGQRGVLTQGVARVTVPAIHERGRLESPSLLRLEFREDSRKHIVLTRATELSQADFYRRLQQTVAQTSESELMVFIHGYNVDFESAVRRTAQLAVDLPFRGVPVCYSWPSQGSLLGYTVDENNVAWSAGHLRDFLLGLVERSGARSINLVAHSMGNRALTTALSDISLMADQTRAAPFDRVVLAAPDVDAGLFAKDLAPRLLQTAASVTLYASSDDKALIASKRVHGYPRAGESGPNIVVVPGVETIDVTGIDLSLLGHSYYGGSRAMLTDLFELMHHRLPADDRRLLQPQQRSRLVYWRLLSSGVAESVSAPVR